MQTLFVGKKHLKFSELDSTNTLMKEMVKSNEIVEGTVIQCDYQTLGRGWSGNRWTAEKGKSLLFSLLLKPSFLSIDQQFCLNMSVCLGLVDVLKYIWQGPVVKWPNDILYNGKKLCGILIENGITENKIDHSIVGIGLNINQESFIYPNATSLRIITASKINIKEILEKILRKIESRYLQLKTNPQAVKKGYFENLYGYRNPVSITIKGKRHLLKIENIEPSGKLIARLDGGKLMTFSFKELSFILPEG